MESRGDAPAPVIDLGLVRDEPELGPEPPRGGRWIRWSVAARRRCALAGCLLLVLVAAGGAEPPWPLLSPVRSWSPGTAAGYTLDGDRLFVMSQGPDSTLSMYDLPGGGLRWSVPMSTPAAQLYAAWRVGGAAVVMTQPPDGSCCHFTAYGEADGEVRWSRQGAPTDIDAANHLLALNVPLSTQVVEMASGQVLWQGAESDVSFLPWPGQILVTTYRDGTVERRDVGTGQVLARRPLFPPEKTLTGLTTVDGQVIVSYASDSRNGTVAAYDVDTLTPRWRRYGSRADWVDSCGPVICLRSGGAMEALDPATGAARWRATEWAGQEWAGRILLFAAGPEEPQPVAVADPLTGRVLLDLRAWRMMSLTAPPGPDLLLRGASAGKGRTALAVADLTRLSLRVVGVIPGEVSDCQRAGAILACRTPDQGLQVWALRR
jgi:PQQ-like domain